MVRFLKRFSKRKVIKRDPARYEREKVLARSEDVEERMELALSRDTHKEILYYLADNDPDPQVRLAVAQNSELPVQASAVLARDASEDVRMALARRLVDLLPGLSQDRHSQLYAYAVQSLGTLALDEVLKIRVALSSTLKDHAHAPPKVVGQLARDVEREVSEPILRFCAAVSDKDLLDILKSHPASWVVQAVAKRDRVSAPVSAAVIEVEDVEGGKALLKNSGAQIGEKLLMTIVEKAKTLKEWQRPMATRAQLPLPVARELAEFVDASVRDLLMSRGDFDESMTEEIAAIFRRRVEFANEEEHLTETHEQRLKRLIKEKRLNEETISDCVAMRDREFLFVALAHMTGTSAESVEKIFEMETAKPVVALAWKAELSMRMALTLQREIAHIPHTALLYPRDGTEYPLTEEEINWQLDFLGLKAA